ncbi:MAG: type II secretion system F family protein [Gemmataceae bacterium]
MAMATAIRLFLLVGLVLCLAFVAWLGRRVWVQQLARQRLAEPQTDEEDETAAPPPPRVRPFVRWHWYIGPLVGLLVAGAVYYFLGLWIFALAFGVIVGLLAGLAESYRVSRLTFRIEEQLADVIDLMVATLHAGAGAMSALDNATRESRRPLRPQLEEMLGRIRYGDDPQEVFHALEQRVPLETFRLFTNALSVHWETGGSLGPTLATVGRVIRDRIEVSRRIHALTTQARASIIAMPLVTYFIAFIMWRSDPERMRQFLATMIGQYLVAGALLMQALGIVWATRMSKLKY